MVSRGTAAVKPDHRDSLCRFSTTMYALCALCRRRNLMERSGLGPTLGVRLAHSRSCESTCPRVKHHRRRRKSCVVRRAPWSDSNASIVEEKRSPSSRNSGSPRASSSGGAASSSKRSVAVVPSRTASSSCRAIFGHGYPHCSPPAVSPRSRRAASGLATPGDGQSSWPADPVGTPRTSTRCVGLVRR
ncbi:MAG: hypothetical protein JWO36_2064 [Myxococcales bacterium]|nr:hypothetical protein [Myxococcales bacterium]